MTDSFVHLHVASGYSMRYGTAKPEQLVERAVAFGQPALALTDRDGLYGAVKFVTACMERGVGPILGVDLALGPDPIEPRRYPGGAPGGGARGAARGRTPVRGGALVDPRLPRVTVLARGQPLRPRPRRRMGPRSAGSSRPPTSAANAATRWPPPELLAELATAARRAAGGSAHPAGRGIRRSREAVASRPARSSCSSAPTPTSAGPCCPATQSGRAALARWRALLPRDALAVEIVCHGGPEGTCPASLGHAARLYALARDHGLRRSSPQPPGTPTRRMPPSSTSSTPPAAWSPSTCATSTGSRPPGTSPDPVDARASRGRPRGRPAPASTAGARWPARGPATSPRDRRRSPPSASSTPALDLGIGSVHLPEQTSSRSSRTSTRIPSSHGAAASRRDPYPDATARERRPSSERLQDELDVIATLGYATYFLTVAHVVDLIRDMGVRVAARGSGAGSVVNYLLGISGVDPMRYGLLMERFCSPLRAQLPDIDIDVESARRTEIYERILARFGGERVTCVSMMDTYRVRHAIRDVGAALGLPPRRSTRWRRRSRTSPRATSATPSPSCPSCGPAGWTCRGSS